MTGLKVTPEFADFVNKPRERIAELETNLECLRVDRDALRHQRDVARAENARLRELITLLEIAGENLSEECASQPHSAKWDSARDEVGSFLCSSKRELAMQKLADEAQERGEYMVQYRAMRSLLLRIHSARIGMNEEAVIAALNDVDAFFREPNNN